MKNKGFTLIELLAVIVILAIIALIATPIILGIISNTRNEARIRSAEAVTHSVETGYLTTYMKCAAEGSSLDTCVTNTKVLENTKIENERSRTTTSITTKDGVVCTLSDAYLLTCTYAEENVIEPKSVNGSSSNGGSANQVSKVCEKQNDTSQTKGAEYICHLDTDRTFYVLKVNTDTIDLIMDRNYIDTNVPVTMKWCTSGTSNTCNHNNLDQYITYIQSKFGSNVTVSLPTKNQIYAVNNSNSLSSASWAYGYTDSDSSTTTIPSGYWTATASSSYTNTAWVVYFQGFLNQDEFVDYENRYGIRPVITISKTLMD